MIRVGYSTNVSAELFSDFPAGIELISLPRDLDHDVEIEVWIPIPIQRVIDTLCRTCVA